MMLPTTTRSLTRQALRFSTSASSTSASQRVVVRCFGSTPSRSMVTKEERWTHETADKASQLLSSGGPNGAALDVKQLLPNIEARWKEMPKEEQYAVFRQLEEIQKKDWKELSLDEKKAGECLIGWQLSPPFAIVTIGERDGGRCLTRACKWPVCRADLLLVPLAGIHATL